MVQPLHIKNAHIWDSSKTAQRDLYTTDVVTAQPAKGAQVVDLDGYIIFPGLINAHDHLELNHYPRSKFREKYDNAHQWGEDMNVRLDSEPYKSLRAYPLWDKLFIGGLKNLLCGATTVVHHNPPHKELWRKDFPVRVLRKYGWTHSLHFSTDEEIISSYRSTPPDVPWFIHLAEGKDYVAREEYKRLKKLGCIGKNTIFVHGVGMSAEDESDAKDAGVTLVLCPTTNLYLLGSTISSESTYMRSRMILGSDSRLTADGDLLDELRAFYKMLPNDGGIYNVTRGLYMVTHAAESALLHQNRREIKLWDTGRNADFIAIKMDYNSVLPGPLYASRRADLALVVKGGVPQIGDPDMMAKFPAVQTVGAMLDGKPKRIHIDLARRIHACKLKEPGLEVDSLPKQGFRFW